MRRGAGRDPRIVAVDQQLRAVLGGIGLGRPPRASSKSSPTWVTVAPSARIRSTLPRLALLRREDDRRHAERARGVRDALPEVAGRGRDDRAGPDRSSPPPPARGRRPTSPRPLNERIGLTVSTLTMTGTPQTPRQALVDVLRRVGEGGVDPVVGGADRLDGQLGDRDQRGRRSGGVGAIRPGKEKRPKEPRSTVVPANASTGKTASGSGPLQARTTLPGATRRREGTYPRVSGFVAASCEGCPQRCPRKPVAAASVAAAQDMKTPEGTTITSCSDPCKQRSDHEMFAAPSGRTTIRRGSRRRQAAADGPNS